jgi:formyltetrahydrofolate deformylase
MEFGIASDKYDGLTERFGLAVAEPFEAEAHLLQLLDGCCDLVVLARYMEIFSGEFLDAGPIIEQDVIRVNHRDDVATLRRLGGDLERTVLARAVLWHCEDRVLRHGNTTIVF